MSNAKRVVGRVIKLAIAGALLYYIFRVVPFAEVIRTLRSAQPAKVVAGLGLLFGARLIAAIRMKLLTDRQGLVFSLSEIFEIGTTATFYGLVLPGIVSGGLIRWYKLARQGQSAGALASLTWDRLADATSVALIGVGCWLLSGPSDPRTTLGPASLGACVGLVGLYLAGFSRRVGALVFPRIEGAARRLRSEWVRTRTAKVAAAGRRYHEVEGNFPYRVAALSLASQLVGLAAFVCWSRSLGMSVGFAELGWARSCYLLTVLLPITFAGLGAREGILILLLRPYGVSGAEAVALAFIQLSGTLMMACLGGLFELRRLWPIRRSAKTATTATALEEDS
ncbi:MAG TPA: lysylphosphatidylglycerol synthase transmembrane domain-containing protein [Gemmatimonadales bacterium]|nr:lysylphosphatidylglycerol synthase transmembrane domain-containing protein [Gemmatimonadales bacterium]